MKDKYNRYFKKIEVVLDAWLPAAPNVSWIEGVFAALGPVRPDLVSSLIEPGRDLLSRGGKRWRPLLMVLLAETLGGEAGAEAALPVTPLVEFPHTASLIHDDIEDNSDERRGKPAVHFLYGTDTAINGGAFLYFLPLACLDALSLSFEEKNRIYRVWGEYMRRLHLGQAMDIAWHRDFSSLPDLEDYERMCRLKTGCLARLAAVLGVYCGCPAGGSGPAEERYGEAAESLGVGFQILDDVKNLAEGIPGKKRGDDVIEGKKSLPVLLYLHRYPEKRKFAVRCFAAARSTGTGAPEVEEFIGALAGAGVLEEARQRGLELIAESRVCFSGEAFADFFDLIS
ncbi:MAG: polyprenyl synthetase family protein [Treponema sp.]|jgi:octaprenyl-diphosphate synthase|nr:polyprenyl synthetase family protein [Treponema sp.]